MARTIYNGDNSYIYTDKEATFKGSATITNTDWLGNTSSITRDVNNNIHQSRDIGNGLNVANVTMGIFNGTLGISGEVISFLKFVYFFGDLSGTTIVEKDAKEDRYSMQASLGFVDGAKNSLYTLYGLVPTSLSFNISRGSPVTFTSNLVYANELKAEDGSAVSYGSKGASFMAHDTYIEIDSKKVRYESASVTMNNTGAGLLHDTNSRFANDWTTGNRSYTWSITMVYDKDSDTDYVDGTDFTQYFYAATTGPLESSTPWTDQMDIVVADGSTTAKIQLDSAWIDSISTPIELGSGRVLMTFSGGAKGGPSGVIITES